MTKYFDNVTAYVMEQGIELRPVQESLLHSLDASRAYLNWFLRYTEGRGAGPVTLYMGMRAGHSMVWRWVKASTAEAVDVVYPSLQEAKYHRYADEAVPLNLGTYATHLTRLNMELTGDWATIPEAPKLVIFDFSGAQRYHAFTKTQQDDLNACLRILDQHNVLTILS